MFKESLVISNISKTKYFGQLAETICDYFPPQHLIGSIYTSPQIGKYIKSIEVNSSELFYGAFYKGEFCGFIHLKLLKNSLHLNHIAVANKFEGNGVGAFLLQNAIDITKQYRTKLTLHVDSRNQKAWSWYKKKGFIEASREEKSKLFIHNCYALPNFETITFYKASDWANFGFTFCDLKFGNVIFKEAGIIKPNFITLNSKHLALLENNFSDFLTFVNEHNFKVVVTGKIKIYERFIEEQWRSIFMEYKE